MTRPLSPREVNALIGPQPLEAGDTLFTVPIDSPPGWQRWEAHDGSAILTIRLSWTRPEGDGWSPIERQ